MQTAVLLFWLHKKKKETALPSLSRTLVGRPRNPPSFPQVSEEAAQALAQVELAVPVNLIAEAHAPERVARPLPARPILGELGQVARNHDRENHHPDRHSEHVSSQEWNQKAREQNTIAQNPSFVKRVVLFQC